MVDLFEHWRIPSIIESISFASANVVRCEYRFKKIIYTLCSGWWRVSEPSHSQLLSWVTKSSPASGVPMYFRVPLIPPVSTLPAGLIPRSQALSISSCRSSMDGTRPGKNSKPCDCAACMYEIWMYQPQKLRKSTIYQQASGCFYIRKSPLPWAFWICVALPDGRGTLWTIFDLARKVVQELEVCLLPRLLQVRPSPADRRRWSD